ncbi:diguanylate cyclase domain-containing protein [Sphaerotilus sp.]|uniref:diguanylate cyclase domain-containing protein n=1 Tax=Sphaerotilus sp. TaxID=2093942 RepID=UPI00286E6059|nr:diguanylate cyclase [Sphaerotilus sp.]
MTPARTRILVVDDDLTARLLMRAALRKAGHEVVLAVDGEDALRQFRAEAFDLVMLDVEMPGLSGYDVCAGLRAEAGELLPIVMVTGMDDLQSVDHAYEAGATDFIAKPLNWALVGHRVRYLLRGYQALLELQQAQARHAAVLAAIPDLLFELDHEGRFIECHSPSSDLLMLPPERFVGRLLTEVLPAAAAAVSLSALQVALEQGTSFGKQYELTLPQGRCWFELSVARKALTAGQTPRVIALARDITARKEAELRVARAAYFDSLTGLPNRPSFMERVSREIGRAERTGQKMAVLFMDLDGFKGVNDTLGHGAGDTILQTAADRFRLELRPADMVSRASPGGLEIEFARLGGDEFTALLLDITGPEDALVVACRIGQVMRQPFQLDDRAVSLSTSIGIALYPDDGREAVQLLKNADMAMYRAKRAGRDQACLYGVLPGC